MKKLIFIIACLVAGFGNLYGQTKSSEEYQTIIERYFNEYSSQPKFQVTTMGEPMIKRSNDIGMWKNPGFASVMKQITLYKYLNFDSSPDNSARIIAQMDSKVKKDKSYDDYFRWELNGVTSAVVLTRGKPVITELVYITIDSKQVHVSSFVGKIDIESVRLLVVNN